MIPSEIHLCSESLFRNSSNTRHCEGEEVDRLEIFGQRRIDAIPIEPMRCEIRYNMIN